jgi:hypothetical protein
VLLVLLALSTGGWQVVDGIRVLRTGRYFGPPTPGPWRHLVSAVGVDPFDMGVPFVILGAAWLVTPAALLLTGSPVAWWALLVTAVATLWYLPVGTLFALLTIAVLVISRQTLLVR